MDENVTRIPLRNKAGDVVAHALIDAEDEELVTSQGRWHRNGNGYAIRFVKKNRINRVQFLHRLLLDLPQGDPRHGDHVNRDRLDNRRSNLRIVSHAHNLQNTSSRGGASAYRGVSWFAPASRWRARATINGIEHHIGYFINELSAADAAREFRLAHMPGAVD